MAFSDYSTTPASNTTIGDETFVGPNMPRDNVRPAIQQLMADGRQLNDDVFASFAMAGIPIYSTLAAGLAATTAGQMFSVVPADGTWTTYRRDSVDATVLFEGVTTAELAAAESASADAVAAAAQTGLDRAQTGADVVTANAAAANALAAAISAQGFIGMLSAAAAALPYEVTAISGGIGTGTGGTPGTYVGGVTGGPSGFAWNYTIGSDGKLASYVIVNPGVAVANTAPTLSLPSGSLTSPTVPTATVAVIPVNRVFAAPSGDGTQRLAWINNAGALSQYPTSGTQYAEYLKSGIDSLQTMLGRARNTAFDPALTLGASASAWQASGAVSSAAANASLTAHGVVQSVAIGTGSGLTFVYNTQIPPGTVLGKYAYATQLVYSADGTHWPTGTHQFLAYTTTTSGIQNNPTVLSQGHEDSVNGDTHIRRYWIKALMPATGLVGRTELGFTALTSSTVAETGGFSVFYSDGPLSTDNTAHDDWTGYYHRDDVLKGFNDDIDLLQGQMSYAALSRPWYNLITNGNLDPEGQAKTFTTTPVYVAAPAGMASLGIYQAVQIGPEGGAILTDDAAILDATANSAPYFASVTVYSSTGSSWPAVKVFWYEGAVNTGSHTFGGTSYEQIDANTRRYYDTGTLPASNALTRIRMGITSALGVTASMSGFQFEHSGTGGPTLNLTNTSRTDWYAQANQPREIAKTSLAVNGVPQLVGATIAWIGDSLVQSAFSGPGVVTLLAQATGATVLNFGFSGHTWALTPNPGSNAITGYKNRMCGSVLLQAIAAYAAGTTTAWDDITAAAASLYAADNTQDHRATVAAMKALNWSTVGLLMHSQGTNDWGTNVTLGALGDTSSSTFYGAIKAGIAPMQAQFPSLPIWLGAPMARFDTTFGDSNINSNGTTMLSAFQQAVVDQADRYQLLRWEPKKNLGFNALNYSPGSAYTTDGLHWTSTAAQQRGADRIAANLRATL